MVRVGPNVKESLSLVALDTLAKKRQARRDIRRDIRRDTRRDILIRLYYSRQTEHGDGMSYEAARLAVLNEVTTC